MKKYAIILLILSVQIFPQVNNFVNIYEGMGVAATSLTEVEENNILLTADGVNLLKFSSNGNFLWTKTLRQPFSYIYKTATNFIFIDSHYIISGWEDYSPSPGTPIGMYVMKCDSDGEIVFHNSIANFHSLYHSYSSAINTTGNIFLVGQGYAPSVGYQGFLCTFNSVGDSVGMKYFYKEGWETNSFFSVYDNFDELIIAGNARKSTGNKSLVFIIKTDYEGNVFFEYEFDEEPLQTFGRQFIRLTDNSYLLLYNKIDYETNKLYKSFIKIDSQGNIVYKKDYSLINFNPVNNPLIAALPYIAHGTSDSGFLIAESENDLIQLTRFSDVGDTLWFKEINFPYAASTMNLKRIAVLSDGGILLTGQLGEALPFNLYLIKTDSLGNVTSVKIGNESSLKYSLEQNYPNPFNPMTNINFRIPEESFVTLKLYDILGREVVSLYNNERKEAGNHTIQFNSENYSLPTGVYIYRIQAGNYTASKKMLFLK